MREQVPLIDGILLENGLWYQAHYEPVCIRGISGFKISSLSGATSRLGDSVEMTSLIELGSIRLGDGRRISCGEGSMGNEGYIACLSSSDDLLWLAFFRQSNPFEALKEEASRIIATNNLGHRWAFSPDDPFHWSVS